VFEDCAGSFGQVGQSDCVTSKRTFPIRIFESWPWSDPKVRVLVLKLRHGDKIRKSLPEPQPEENTENIFNFK
jgi:hypothetical protein